MQLKFLDDTIKTKMKIKKLIQMLYLMAGLMEIYRTKHLIAIVKNSIYQII
jgi:hypothetical protein